MYILCFFFFFQAEDGIRDYKVTGVQTCALPISSAQPPAMSRCSRNSTKASSERNSSIALICPCCRLSSKSRAAKRKGTTTPDETKASRSGERGQNVSAAPPSSNERASSLSVPHTASTLASCHANSVPTALTRDPSASPAATRRKNGGHVLKALP